MQGVKGPGNRQTGGPTLVQNALPQPMRRRRTPLPKARMSSALTAAVKVFTRQSVVRPAKAAL